MRRSAYDRQQSPTLWLCRPQIKAPARLPRSEVVSPTEVNTALLSPARAAQGAQGAQTVVSSVISVAEYNSRVYLSLGLQLLSSLGAGASYFTSSPTA